jgi:hypothetical protein
MEMEFPSLGQMALVFGFLTACWFWFAYAQWGWEGLAIQLAVAAVSGTTSFLVTLLMR